jgi:hypothetical protein
MELITNFKDVLHVFNLKKKDDLTLFSKVQRAIANAFDLPCAEDIFDSQYSYVVSIDKDENNEVVSGYRHILCKNARNGNSFNLNTFKYYDFSSDFSKNYADYTLELGRSFVNPVAKRKIWGLFSIWECGLGPLINYQREHNGIQYILGQVSLKENVYDVESIKAILKMFWVNFGTITLLSPRQPTFSKNELETFIVDSKLDFSGDYKSDKLKLTKFLKEKEQAKPTLFLSYADLIDGKERGLSCFLPIYNSLLKCYEMGFLLKISEISTESRERYLRSSYNPQAFA